MTLTAAGCVADTALPAAEKADLDPISFFEGRTHGDGELKKLFGRPVRISVDSVGRVVNGSLILDQTIREDGAPARVRRWTIRKLSPGRYTGTLTDAAGEVRLTVVGARARITYTLPHGLMVHQELARQSDRHIVLNRLRVHKFGVRVATLNETIRRLS
jgi:hypothetical protein